MTPLKSVASVVLAAAPATGLADEMALNRSVSEIGSSTRQAEITMAAASNEMMLKVELEGWCPKSLDIPKQAKVRLFKEPELFFAPVAGEFRIPDWDIVVKAEQSAIARLPLLMARQFMRLLRASQNGNLPESKLDVWQKILVAVDYGDYCEQTRPLTWTVGTRIKAVGGGVLVDWGDGETEELTGDFAEQLSIVEDGESFSALTKFVHTKLSEMRDVASIDGVSPDVDDLSWIS